MISYPKANSCEIRGVIFSSADVTQLYFVKRCFVKMDHGHFCMLNIVKAKWTSVKDDRKDIACCHRMRRSFLTSCSHLSCISLLLHTSLVFSVRFQFPSILMPLPTRERSNKDSTGKAPTFILLLAQIQHFDPNRSSSFLKKICLDRNADSERVTE